MSKQVMGFNTRENFLGSKGEERNFKFKKNGMKKDSETKENMDI